MTTYSTTDLYTTAVLLFSDFHIVKVTSHGDSGRVKRFHFEDSEELQNTILQYMNGTLHGDIRKFRNSIEVTKDLVHSS